MGWSRRSRPDLLTDTLRGTPERRELSVLRSKVVRSVSEFGRPWRRSVFLRSCPLLRSSPHRRSAVILRSPSPRRSTSGQEPRGGAPCIAFSTKCGFPGSVLSEKPEVNAHFGKPPDANRTCRPPRSTDYGFSAVNQPPRERLESGLVHQRDDRHHSEFGPASLR